MLNGRTRTTALLAGIAAAATVGLTLSVPAQAEPEIDDVEARVDRLFHEAEQAQERFHDAQLELDELNAELGSLEADETQQGDRLAEVRGDVRDSIIQQHQGQSIGANSDLLSADTGAFLSDLSTLSTVNDLQDSLLSDYNDELKAFTIRREETEDRRDEIADIEADLAEEQKAVDEKLAAAEALLEELEAEEREAILSRDSDRVPSVDASGRAQAAIDYLMAQVGDAYVFGAAGPDAWDCSGLTMMAWAQAGVSLPHSSSAQYGTGTRVAESDLQPGDLVFYYSPISHVEMYIGNGMIAGAANPGAGVRVASLHSMPYVGAVRPG